MGVGWGKTMAQRQEELLRDPVRPGRGLVEAKFWEWSL